MGRDEGDEKGKDGAGEEKDKGKGEGEGGGGGHTRTSFPPATSARHRPLVM